MKSATRKKCLLCGSRENKTIFSFTSPDKYESSVGVDKKRYFRKWVRCKKCGFYYSVYSRPAKILERIYLTTYRDKTSAWRKESPEDTFKKIISLPKSKSETYYRTEWIKKNISELEKDGVLQKSSNKEHALDIGGGAGLFAFAFRDKNWKTYIIDPSKNNSFIKAKLKIPLAQKFYRPNLFPVKFDLISLIYVLEHVSDPINFLKAVRKDLKADALIYIEVPYSMAFSLKQKDDDIFNSCHLWMFDPKSLVKILDICGFEALKLNRLKTLRGHYSLMLLASKK